MDAVDQAGMTAFFGMLFNQLARQLILGVIPPCRIHCRSQMNQVIQIAGVIDYAEALMLLEADVNFLGFPLRLPDDREDLSETQAREIIRLIGNRVHTVLVTYLGKASEIAELSDYLGVN